MTTISPIQAGAQVGTVPAQSSSVISSDFETFLAMLTAQMQNQDPLNPMDSTDFATQLATFSGVEQQVRTNELLQEVQGALALSGMGQLASWVGMEARAEMSAVFAGAPISLAAPRENLADTMTLVITNPSGSEVQRLAVPAADTPFEWAGVSSDGSPLPEGSYDFTVEYHANGTLIGTRPAQVYAMVEEALLRDGQVWLAMPGGVTVAADTVQAVRTPGGL